MITALSLIRLNPAALAALIQAKTRFKSPVRVSALKRAACKESRLMLIRSTPDETKLPAYFGS